MMARPRSRPSSKAEEARIRRAMAAVAPYTEELTTIRELLDEWHRKLLNAVVDGKTDRRSLEAVITDLRETVGHWS